MPSPRPINIAIRGEGGYVAKNLSRLQKILEEILPSRNASLLAWLDMEMAAGILPTEISIFPFDDAAYEPPSA